MEQRLSMGILLKENDWISDPPPSKFMRAWVKLENGKIEKAIRRENTRNGDTYWTWFNENGYVIGWASPVIFWTYRD